MQQIKCHNMTLWQFTEAPERKRSGRCREKFKIGAFAMIVFAWKGHCNTPRMPRITGIIEPLMREKSFHEASAQMTLKVMANAWPTFAINCFPQMTGERAQNIFLSTHYGRNIITPTIDPYYYMLLRNACDELEEQFPYLRLFHP